MLDVDNGPPLRFEKVPIDAHQRRHNELSEIFRAQQTEAARSFMDGKIDAVFKIRLLD